MSEGGMTEKDVTRELWSGKRMEGCVLIGNTGEILYGYDKEQKSK